MELRRTTATVGMGAVASGFSLIELLIVIAIIGILTAIALPNYNDYVRKGKMTEAFSSLASMRTQMEQYFLDNRTYVGGPCTASDPKYFSFACSNVAATTYLITATGVAAQGMSGYVYTVDQANAKQTTQFAGAAVTKTCWATSLSTC